MDIGLVGHAGSASSCGGPFTISGSGNDIWNDADAFHFVYVPMNGNGAIRAHVVSVQYVDTNAKGGVMIRETLTASPAMRWWTLSRRLETSSFGGAPPGVMPPPASPIGLTAPYWVQLTRTNNVFQASMSPDGISWDPLGDPVTITMAPTVYAGLAVCARDNVVICTSVFDNVYVSSVINNPPPMLAAISNQTVNVGQTVALTASATDVDYPVAGTDLQPARRAGQRHAHSTEPYQRHFPLAARGDRCQHHQSGDAESDGQRLPQPERHAELHDRGQSFGIADGAVGPLEQRPVHTARH